MHVKRLRTSRLELAYLEHGPADAPVVLLLHGFPDDATSWRSVMEALAERGFRSLAPFVRGCGGTRFLDEHTPRAGDFAALGQDALDFIDAADLHDVIVVGQDWGSPTAEMIAMLRPDRVRRLVKLNWYGVYTMFEMSRAQSFAYSQLRTLWYVWLLNLPLGEMALKFDRPGFARALWAEWSPTWDAEKRETALEAVTPSFASDDWLRVALSAYRANLTEAERDSSDDALRTRLQDPVPVRCEVVIAYGTDDGVERSPLSNEALARWFPAGLTLLPLPGVGHFPQREAPARVVEAVLGRRPIE